MTRRIFRNIFLTSLAALCLVSALVMITLHGINENDAKNKLKLEAVYLADLIKGKDSENLKQIYSFDRITLIAEEGTVIYDNTAEASSMENHAGRPEVEEALRTGTGESYRYSDTLSQKTIYYAIKTDLGNILRVSKTQSSVLGLIGDMLPILILIVLVIALLSYLIARHMSRRITAPIGTLDLDSPFENDIYDELSPMLTRIEQQKKELESKMLEISERHIEFTAVTENMREGLILLSDKGNILSINASAAEALNTDIEKCVGSHILSVNRSISMRNVFEGALGGKSTEAFLEINKRNYQLLGNPIVSGGGIPGALILLLDVTDKHSAERSRREFTANVSHELKTPLTSILGYAEIMKDGLAKQEDMQGFAGRIYFEASRLLSLIGDILELSQLDEKENMPEKEHIDLYTMAEEVKSRLKPMADKYGVSLSVQGEHIEIAGYRKILDEMIFNLCDNAIKYNTAGGSADIIISKKENRPVITVRDNGIGIPAEHQPHIFERFYRVDKSRSKDIGGTGLGLSIVKHGAMLHDAAVDMKSDGKSGTTFEIVFPCSGKV